MLGGDAEDESEPLEAASGSEEEGDCVCVPVASIPADEEDIEGGGGADGTVNVERLELFVPIIGEVSPADGAEAAASFTPESFHWFDPFAPLAGIASPPKSDVDVCRMLLLFD